MKQHRENLADGQYWATCRERGEMAAIMNGHGCVFPQAKMTVKNGVARFYRDGKEVWDCNSIYAAAHFDIQKV